MPGDELADSASVAVGPDGGSLVADDGKLVLTIPAGAVAEDVTLQATHLDLDEPNILAAYELTPNGLGFEVPIALQISVPDSLPDDRHPSEIRLVHLWETGEELVANQRYDSGTSRLQGNLDHFSRVLLQLPELGVGPTRLAGSAERETSVAGGTTHLVVGLWFEPVDRHWELQLTVEHDFRNPTYQLDVFGVGAAPQAQGLAEGSTSMNGSCLFAFGGDTGEHQISAVGVPFFILAPKEPQAGDQVEVILNQDGDILIGYQDADVAECPILDERQDFSVTLETSDIVPPVPLE